MGRLMRTSLLVLFFVTACFAADSLYAQKGRGGGGGWKGGGGGGGGGWKGGSGGWKGGGGGFQGGGKKGGGGFQGGSVQGGGNKGGGSFQGKGNSSGGQFGSGKGSLTDSTTQLTGKHPGDMQRLNEQRKLDHRRKIADHLREMSKTSGNEHLNDVADRLDKKAQEHYDKRMEKLNSRDGVSDDADDALAGADDAPGGTPSDTDDALADIDDPSAPADNTLADTGDAPADDAPADDALSDADESPGDDMLDGDAPTGDQIEDVARKLTGRENALDRQLRNEERKFNQRMEAVDRLRQLAEQTGDSQFLDAAERLESAALDHYEQRLAKITEFQQRFNLPDFDSLPVSTPSP